MTQAPSAPVQRTGNTAAIPVQKLEEDFYDWYVRHSAKCREAACANHDLVFIGDSITHLFEGDPNVPNRGERVWEAHYGNRNALNLGFGWDRTQNVLWRRPRRVCGPDTTPGGHPDRHQQPHWDGERPLQHAGRDR
jgi:hypothetical protein